MEEVGEIGHHQAVVSDFGAASLSIGASTASPTLSTAPPVMPNMLKILRAHARNEVTDASRWARWNFDVRRKAPGCPSVESHRGRSGLRWQGQAALLPRPQPRATDQKGRARASLARFCTLFFRRNGRNRRCPTALAGGGINPHSGPGSVPKSNVPTVAPRTVACNCSPTRVGVGVCNTVGKAFSDSPVNRPS